MPKCRASIGVQGIFVLTNKLKLKIEFSFI